MAQQGHGDKAGDEEEKEREEGRRGQGDEGGAGQRSLMADRKSPGS